MFKLNPAIACNGPGSHFLILFKLIYIWEKHNKIYCNQVVMYKPKRITSTRNVFRIYNKQRFRCIQVNFT